MDKAKKRWNVASSHRFIDMESSERMFSSRNHYSFLCMWSLQSISKGLRRCDGRWPTPSWMVYCQYLIMQHVIWLRFACTFSRFKWSTHFEFKTDTSLHALSQYYGHSSRFLQFYSRINMESSVIYLNLHLYKIPSIVCIFFPCMIDKALNMCKWQ